MIWHQFSRRTSTILKRLIVFAACLLFAVASTSSIAQFVEQFPTGLKPSTPEELAKFPQTPVFRDFLPERVDLSSSFPRPGHQKYGTCTAWAVSYARAYYANVLEHRTPTDAGNIPSPPYIFDAIKSSNLEKGDKGCMTGGSAIPNALALLKFGGLSFRDYSELNTAQCFPISTNQRLAAKDF
jgi:hypothetical protein